MLALLLVQVLFINKAQIIFLIFHLTVNLEYFYRLLVNLIIHYDGPQA